VWVVSRDAVEDAVQELWGRRIHEQLPGYLCLVWTAARTGRVESLRPDFKAFHDYFMRVPDRAAMPYLRPFNSAKRRTAAGKGRIWYQENVAGSYTPSSLRGGGTLPKVVEVTGEKATASYSLRNRHAALALEHFAYGVQIPIVPLALYLYREFAFDTPSTGAVASVFRYEFGYQSATGAENGDDFATLYSDDSEGETSTDLFEEYDA